MTSSSTADGESSEVYPDPADSISNENYHRPSLSSSSFKSLTSYPSFRSCTTYKSANSFRSVVSRKTTATHGTSFHSCLGDGQVNKAFDDTESFYSLTLPDQLESMKQTNGVAHPIPQPPPANLNAKPEPPKSLPSHIQCLLLIVLSTIFFSTSSVLLEFFLTQKSYSISFPWIFLFFRSCLQLLLSSSFLLFFKLNPFGPSGHRWILYLTSLLSFLISVTLVVGSTKLNSSTGFLSSMILISIPITLMISLILGRESLGIYRFLTALLFLVGATLLSRPSFLMARIPAAPLHHFNIFQFNPFGLTVISPQSSLVPESFTSSPMGMFSASLVPFFFSFLIFVTHKCRVRGISVTVLMLWISLGTLLASLMGVGTLNSQMDALLKIQGVDGLKYPTLNTTNFDISTILAEFSSWTWDHWVVMSAHVFLATLATFLTVLAAGKVKPGRTLLIRSVQILLTFALQSALFPSLYAPAWQDLCGAVVMTLAVLFVGLEEIIVDKKKWKWF